MSKERVNEQIKIGVNKTKINGSNFWTGTSKKKISK